MAFIAEDGTGIADANSYLSVADADSYHSDRGNALWTGVDAVKEAALIRATAYLEALYTWTSGIKSTQAQGLSWPRVWAFGRDGYALTGVPVQVKDATAELALRSLSETLGADLGQQVLSKKVGEVAVTYSEGSTASKRYPLVDGMLRGLAAGRSGMVDLYLT